MALKAMAPSVHDFGVKFPVIALYLYFAKS